MSLQLYGTPVPTSDFRVKLYSIPLFFLTDRVELQYVLWYSVVGKVTVIKLLRYVTSYFFKLLVTVSLLSK